MMFSGGDALVDEEEGAQTDGRKGGGAGVVEGRGRCFLQNSIYRHVRVDVWPPRRNQKTDLGTVPGTN